MKKAIILLLVLSLAGCSYKAISSENSEKSSVKEEISSSISSISSNSNITSSKINSSNNSLNLDAEIANLTPQQLGTLVALFKYPDWFKSNLTNKYMFYGENGENLGSAFNGFHYVTAAGDPTSYIYFKRSGNNVIIKYVDPTPSSGVANAPIKTESIPIERLLKDYYVTPGQKNEVNNYANQIQPISAFLNRVNTSNQS